MKEQKKKSQPPPWYEQIWERVELVNTNPELAPYLDVDKFPQYHANVTAKLISQGLPLTPLKKLKTITPEKLGLVLGQQCATAYALIEHFQSLAANPKAIKQAEKTLKVLRKNRHVPGVSSVLHADRITKMMVQEWMKDFPRFEKNLHAALKAALNQPNYQEAVEFFHGFAKGISKPGIKDGKLTRRTDATTLQMKMFMHTEQAAELKKVPEWRTFLLKNGLTEQMLGHKSRLEKFCTRIGYAPGKRPLEK